MERKAKFQIRGNRVQQSFMSLYVVYARNAGRLTTSEAVVPASFLFVGGTLTVRTRSTFQHALPVPINGYKIENRNRNPPNQRVTHL